MRIRIFQPKSVNAIERRDPKDYNLVYGGKVECKSIDDIVSICNSEFSQPPGFCGEAVTSGYIIEIYDGSPLKGTYLLNANGYDTIDFNTEMADKSNTMTVMILEPLKKPYTAEIKNDYKGLQSVVGGLIEPVYFEPANDAVIFCNEEFLLNGSFPNRIVGGICIHGTFCITGNGINDYGEQDSCSLTNEQISKYTDRFSKNMLITPMSLINGELDQIMDDSEDMTMMMM